MKIKVDAVICDGSAADLTFPKESLTRSRLFSDIFSTYQNGGVTLLLSSQNIGSIVTFFAVRQGLIEKQRGRIPFYFDDATWEQMCILRDRADDLAKSVQNKIKIHEDPFHSVMIRRLEADQPHLGGLGLKRAIAKPFAYSSVLSTC